MSIEVLEQLAMCGNPEQAAKFVGAQSPAFQHSMAKQDVALMQSIVLQQQSSLDQELLAMQANEVMVTHY